MAYEKKVNSGSLWPNDRREKEKQPNSTGSMLLQCPHCQVVTDWWQNGWTKTTVKDGKPVRWVSQSLKPKDRPPLEAPKPAAASDDEFGDEIPF